MNKVAFIGNYAKRSQILHGAPLNTVMYCTCIISVIINVELSASLMTFFLFFFNPGWRDSSHYAERLLQSLTIIVHINVLFWKMIIRTTAECSTVLNTSLLANYRTYGTL